MSGKNSRIPRPKLSGADWAGRYRICVFAAILIIAIIALITGVLAYGTAQ